MTTTECVTHHYACDCIRAREDAVIEQKNAEIERLRASLASARGMLLRYADVLPAVVHDEARRIERVLNRD